MSKKRVEVLADYKVEIRSVFLVRILTYGPVVEMLKQARISFLAQGSL